VTSGPGPADDASPAGQRAVEEGDLAHSLNALSHLAAGRLPLDQLLTRVARYAVRAIPGADGAGLTLVEKDRTDTVVTTADFVHEVDALQYGLGEGPGVTAAHEARTVISGSLGGDPRWRRFGGRIARMGVHSVVSLPLLAPDEVVGALNVYAYSKHAFDLRAAELGELYAGPAAIAVQNARVLAEAQRLTGRLQAALKTRMVIERAIGILIGRFGESEQEALARLTALSQHRHVKLVQVAQSMVDEAVRGAVTARPGAQSAATRPAPERQR
jgi:GAF domain-containing protein